MTDQYDLQRFVAAQDSHGTYSTALAELRRGRKTSHWMWFVFPQIQGLGSSPTARRYAISSLDEARAYLRHPVLGARLRECTRVLGDLQAGSAEDVLGSVDAMKLRSCLTLFAAAAPGEDLFSRVLARYFDGADPATTARLSPR